MSDLAENIRLYGGSQVLEMVQSLDSPVWNIQQVCSFFPLSVPSLPAYFVRSKCFFLVLMRQTQSFKGAGLFQKARQTEEQAAGRGTSRYPKGIKSWPEPIGNWILMKIISLCHKISHFWWKIAIVWAILGHFWHVFADFFVSVT